MHELTSALVVIGQLRFTDVKVISRRLDAALETGLNASRMSLLAKTDEKKIAKLARKRLGEKVEKGNVESDQMENSRRITRPLS